MPEILKDQRKISWICAVLMTVDLLLILAGYFSFFQTQWQLTSPLIPRSTAYQVFADSGNNIMHASIAAACVFVAGLWLFAFQKKKAAVAVFLVVPVVYFIWLR